MSHARILDALKPDVLKADRNGLRSLALACTLLVVLAALPLHAQVFQDLYDFNCSTGGCKPADYGYLKQGKDGNLYGTTSEGGSHNAGTIFMVTPSSPVVYTDLYSFDGVTAAAPLDGLTLASDGNLYGTTNGGGTHGVGTVFRFAPPPLSTFKVLHNFSTVGPFVAPVQAKDGNLYGLTSNGLPYRVTLPAGTVTLLPPSLPRADISAPLLLASDGNLYGTSMTGGTFGGISGFGTVFRMSTTGAFTVLHNFTGISPDGAGPAGPLTQASNGLLYGTTTSGGAGGFGVVFEMSLSGTYKTLHSFKSPTEGGEPVDGLLAAADGLLYGATETGGADGWGTLFKMSKAGVLTKLFDFTGKTGAVPGANPNTTLVAHTNGTFYGLTYFEGGAFGDGDIYSLTPPNPLSHIALCCSWWVILDQPVTILGENLTGVVSVDFGSVPAQFQPGSDTYLTAEVPSAAVDALITVTLATGQQLESQQIVHILPKITNLDPSSGPVGTEVAIVGGGFKGATEVTFGGVKATSFTVVSPSLIRAVVPTGAKTGKASVTTHNGTATSKETFTVN